MLGVVLAEAAMVVRGMMEDLTYSVWEMVVMAQST